MLPTSSICMDTFWIFICPKTTTEQPIYGRPTSLVSFEEKIDNKKKEEDTLAALVMIEGKETDLKEIKR
jgi:hypothetical protein